MKLSVIKPGVYKDKRNIIENIRLGVIDLEISNINSLANIPKVKKQSLILFVKIIDIKFRLAIILVNQKLTNKYIHISTKS